VESNELGSTESGEFGLVFTLVKKSELHDVKNILIVTTEMLMKIFIVFIVQIFLFMK